MRRSTTWLHLAIAIVLLATLDGPARAAAKYDYDPTVDFSKYKSFRFLGEAPDGTPRAPRNPQGRPQLSPLVEKQIGESVKAALQGKGLELEEQGPADLGVVIHTGQHREVVGYGWGPRYTGPRRVEVNKEGVLTIDLVDRAARRAGLAGVDRGDHQAGPGEAPQADREPGREGAQEVPAVQEVRRLIFRPEGR